MNIISAQITMDGWGGTKLYIGAEIITSMFAHTTFTAWDAWFYGYPVT